MKKFLVSLALVAGFATSLFAFEWGGLITNVTNVATPDFKEFGLNQSNGAYLWCNSFLNESKTLRFSGEALYKYSMPLPADKKGFKNIVDLDLLKLTGNWGINGSLLNLNAGRFVYSDKTGNIFDQVSDGVNVSYSTYNWNVGAYAGYTGLLNRFNVFMYSVPDDSKVEQFYDLSYGYVPILVDFTFTNLGDNSLGVQAGYFLDATGNKYDKLFGSLFARGPISGIGNYFVSATVGTIGFDCIMLRASFDLSFFIKQNFLFSIGADYASGDNKVFTTFEGITQLPIHNSLFEAYTDAIVPRCTFMFALDKFAISIDEKLVTTIPEKFVVNGLDSTAGIVFNVFSDLKLSAAVNAYTNFVNKDEGNFGASLNAAFAF